MRFIISNTYEELSQKAAKHILKVINDNPNAVLGLATGSTPIGMYEELIKYTKEEIADFSRVVTFNLDEYIGIPPSHPQSYHYFMQTHFFNHININPQNTHIPNGMAKDLLVECAAYDNQIKSYGDIDIQVLGIGNNGHIGFNEPDDELTIGTHITKLTEDTIKANSRFFESIEQVPTHAITMGLGEIMKAKAILLLANGESKAEIISKLQAGKIDTRIPASVLQMHPNVTVIVDRAAGKLI